MNELDEEIALSILFANTKRKKRDADLLTIAKACNYLINLYGSQEAVAEKVGLSAEMIRQFLAILKLPKELQRMFSRREIDSVDVAKELLALKDPQKQVVAAKAIAKSLSKDVRDIKRLIKDADFSVEKAKRAVLDAKPKELHIFVIDFDDEIYRAIIQHAKVMKVKPAELVREIVLNWLKERARIDKKQEQGAH